MNHGLLELYWLTPFHRFSLSVRFAMMAMTGLISHELVKESGQRMGERGVVPLHCACAACSSAASSKACSPIWRWRCENASPLFRILDDQNRLQTFDTRQDIRTFGPVKDTRKAKRRKRPPTVNPQWSPTTVSPLTRATHSRPSTELNSIMQEDNRKMNPTSSYSRRRHDAILDALTEKRQEHHRLLQEERKLEGRTDGIICARRVECKPHHNRLNFSEICQTFWSFFSRRGCVPSSICFLFWNGAGERAMHDMICSKWGYLRYC